MKIWDSVYVCILFCQGVTSFAVSARGPDTGFLGKADKKIISFSGIQTYNLQSTKPMHYQIGYRDLDPKDKTKQSM